MSKYGNAVPAALVPPSPLPIIWKGRNYLPTPPSTPFEIDLPPLTPKRPVKPQPTKRITRSQTQLTDAHARITPRHNLIGDRSGRQHKLPCYTSTKVEQITSYNRAYNYNVSDEFDKAYSTPGVGKALVG